MSASVLIVEDEPLAQETLRQFIGEIECLHLLACASDGLTAARMIDDLRPDLIFLDVQLPEISGLQLLKRIRHRPAIIFTTAYDDYAVPAFELEALDYLLKPFGRERFQRAAERVRRRLTNVQPEQDAAQIHERIETAMLQAKEATPLTRLFVRDARGRVVHLRADDISHLTAEDDYVRIHTAGKSYLVSLTLKDFEQRLDPSRFRRVHRAAIVNLEKIVSFEPRDRRYLLNLRDGATVLASRAGTQALRDLIV